MEDGGGSDGPPIERIREVFHLSAKDACNELGVSQSRLKKICRQHGISRWPHRKLASLEVLRAQIQKEAAVPADELEALLARLDKQVKAVLEDPDRPLEKEFADMRQTSYKLRYHQKSRQQRSRQRRGSCGDLADEDADSDEDGDDGDAEADDEEDPDTESRQQRAAPAVAAGASRAAAAEGGRRRRSSHGAPAAAAAAAGATAAAAAGGQRGGDADAAAAVEAAAGAGAGARVSAGGTSAAGACTRGRNAARASNGSPAAPQSRGGGQARRPAHIPGPGSPTDGSHGQLLSGEAPQMRRRHPVQQQPGQTSPGRLAGQSFGTNSTGGRTRKGSADSMTDDAEGGGGGGGSAAPAAVSDGAEEGEHPSGGHRAGPHARQHRRSAAARGAEGPAAGAAACANPAAVAAPAGTRGNQVVQWQTAIPHALHGAHPAQRRRRLLGAPTCGGLLGRASEGSGSSDRAGDAGLADSEGVGDSGTELLRAAATAAANAAATAAANAAATAAAAGATPDRAVAALGGPAARLLFPPSPAVTLDEAAMVAVLRSQPGEELVLRSQPGEELNPYDDALFGGVGGRRWSIGSGPIRSRGPSLAGTDWWEAALASDLLGGVDIGGELGFERLRGSMSLDYAAADRLRANMSVDGGAAAERWRGGTSLDGAAAAAAAAAAADPLLRRRQEQGGAAAGREPRGQSPALQPPLQPAQPQQPQLQPQLQVQPANTATTAAAALAVAAAEGAPPPPQLQEGEPGPGGMWRRMTWESGNVGCARASTGSGEPIGLGGADSRSRRSSAGGSAAGSVGAAMWHAADHSRHGADPGRGSCSEGLELYAAWGGGDLHGGGGGGGAGSGGGCGCGGGGGPADPRMQSQPRPQSIRPQSAPAQLSCQPAEARAWRPALLPHHQPHQPPLQQQQQALVQRPLGLSRLQLPTGLCAAGDSPRMGVGPFASVTAADLARHAIADASAAGGGGGLDSMPSDPWVASNVTPTAGTAAAAMAAAAAATAARHRNQVHTAPAGVVADDDDSAWEPLFDDADPRIVLRGPARAALSSPAEGSMRRGSAEWLGPRAVAGSVSPRTPSASRRAVAAAAAAAAAAAIGAPLPLGAVPLLHSHGQDQRLDSSYPRAPPPHLHQQEQHPHPHPHPYLQQRQQQDVFRSTSPWPASESAGLASLPSAPHSQPPPQPWPRPQRPPPAAPTHPPPPAAAVADPWASTSRDRAMSYSSGPYDEPPYMALPPAAWPGPHEPRRSRMSFSSPPLPGGGGRGDWTDGRAAAAAAEAPPLPPQSAPPPWAQSAQLHPSPAEHQEPHQPTPMAAAAEAPRSQPLPQPDPQPRPHSHPHQRQFLTPKERAILALTAGLAPAPHQQSQRTSGWLQRGAAVESSSQPHAGHAPDFAPALKAGRASAGWSAMDPRSDPLHGAGLDLGPDPARYWPHDLVAMAAGGGGGGGGSEIALGAPSASASGGGGQFALAGGGGGDGSRMRLPSTGSSAIRTLASSVGLHEACGIGGLAARQWMGQLHALHYERPGSPSGAAMGPRGSGGVHSLPRLSGGRDPPGPGPPGWDGAPEELFRTQRHASDSNSSDGGGYGLAASAAEVWRHAAAAVAGLAGGFSAGAAVAAAAAAGAGGGGGGGAAGLAVDPRHAEDPLRAGGPASLPAEQAQQGQHTWGRQRAPGYTQMQMQMQGAAAAAGDPASAAAEGTASPDTEAAAAAAAASLRPQRAGPGHAGGGTPLPPLPSVSPEPHTHPDAPAPRAYELPPAPLSHAPPDTALHMQELQRRQQQQSLALALAPPEASKHWLEQDWEQHARDAKRRLVDGLAGQPRALQLSGGTSPYTPPGGGAAADGSLAAAPGAGANAIPGRVGSSGGAERMALAPPPAPLRRPPPPGGGGDGQGGGGGWWGTAAAAAAAAPAPADADPLAALAEAEPPTMLHAGSSFTQQRPHRGSWHSGRGGAALVPSGPLSLLDMPPRLSHAASVGSGDGCDMSLSASAPSVCYAAAAAAAGSFTMPRRMASQLAAQIGGGWPPGAAAGSSEPIRPGGPLGLAAARGSRGDRSGELPAFSMGHCVEGTAATPVLVRGPAAHQPQPQQQPQLHERRHEQQRDRHSPALQGAGVVIRPEREAEVGKRKRQES